MAAVSDDAIAALEIYFEEVFQQLIMSLLKAESHEVGFNELRVRDRRLTQDQVATVAMHASRYYVERINSNRRLSHKEIHALKVRAVNYAVKQLEDEQE